MKICAIIAEYNPFHNAHLYHIAKAKAETECDTLIVLLSGSFSRRGEACFADKSTRANWAILAGADCVFELPAVFTLSNTHDFVYGALRMLKPLGELTLSFGSECGNFDTLESTVEQQSFEHKDFQTMFQNFISSDFRNEKRKKTTNNQKNNPFVSETTANPKNVLGVEFIKTAEALKMELNFHTVKLIDSPQSEDFLSSATIRKKVRENLDFSKSTPPFVQVTCPNFKKLDALSLYAINNLSEFQLAKIANIDNGFEIKLKKSSFTSINELTALASKHNSKTAIKRMAICAALGITKENVKLAKNSKPYYSVLALRNGRDDILTKLAQVSKNVFLKSSDCLKKNKVKPLLDIDEKAAKLLSLI